MSSIARLSLRSARPSLMVQRSNVQRAVVKRQMHADPNYNMPFNYTNTTKRVFALKALAYMGTGFAIPFIAIWWHWNRPGGLNNSK